mgnify:CR=1 FL=1
MHHGRMHQNRLDLWPVRLAAEGTYGSAENLACPVNECEIERLIPMFDKFERQDGTEARQSPPEWAQAMVT